MSYKPLNTKVNKYDFFSVCCLTYLSLLSRRWRTMCLWCWSCRCRESWGKSWMEVNSINRCYKTKM